MDISVNISIDLAKRTALQPPDEPGLNVFGGDSITDGYGTTSPEKAYPYLLEAMTGDESLVYAQPERTVQSNFGNYIAEYQNSLRYTLFKPNPDSYVGAKRVILSPAGNDVLVSFNDTGTNADTFKAVYKECILKIVSTGVALNKFMLINIGGFYPDANAGIPPEVIALIPGRIAEYKNKVIELGQELGITVITPINDQADYADSFHLNDQGHYKRALLIYNALNN